MLDKMAKNFNVGKITILRNAYFSLVLVETFVKFSQPEILEFRQEIRLLVSACTERLALKLCGIWGKSL